MTIVFSINPLGLEGLGSTLTSLIRNCSNNMELKLCFLCSDLDYDHKSNIQQLLENENFKGQFEFVDFDAKLKFGKLKSLHGDWTTYGRLLIPDIITTDHALYLDSDLVINTDVLKLKNIRSDKILAAVCGTTVEKSLDNPFFVHKLNWHPNTNYFNAGILIFNISKWKEEKTGNRIKKIAHDYPNELLSSDQTLLNAVCEGDFTHLPEEFNVPWYPNKAKLTNIDRAIIHFVGSPKPWDIFGRAIHSGYHTWNIYNTPFWKRKYSKITVDKIRRTWKIRRSLVKNLKDKCVSAIKTMQ